MKRDLKIITVTADIHPDGDVFVKGKKGFKYVGILIEEDKVETVDIPNKTYLRAKKINNQLK